MSLVFSHIEKTVKVKFDYDKINYLALMMIDFHVHFHIIPRYSEKKEMHGIDIIDNDWPKPPNVLEGTPLSESLSKQLISILKS